MAIYYVDLVSGNDANGGTDPLLPKLTVASAVTAASANDEIRIAKTAAPTVISGCTFGFTLGSATITTSADMRGSLAVGDVIGKTTAQGNGYQTETYYKIDSITAVAINLKYGFGGVTESVTSINKIISIGSTGNFSTKKLSCSGGWNLSSIIIDGETWITGSTSNFYRATGSTVSYINAVNTSSGYFGAGTYDHLTVIGSSACFSDASVYLSNCVLSSAISYAVDVSWLAGLISNCLFVNCNAVTNSSSNNVDVLGCTTVACTTGIISCRSVTSSISRKCLNGFSGNALITYCDSIDCGNGFVNNKRTENCTATSCTTYGFYCCQNLISCNAIDCQQGFYNPYYMTDCSTLRSTLYGIISSTTDASAGACIRNHLSTNDAIGIYASVNTVNCYNCSFITPVTWGISRVLTAGAAITCVGCTIDAPSLSKAYNRVAGVSYTMPQYYLQNSFNNLTGTIYANTTVLEDPTTTPHSLQIIFYGTSGLQFSPIRVASLWSKQSIPLTINLQVWAPSGTFTGTVVPSLTLNQATLITLPTITTITSSIQTLTFSVTQAMMTADGMLEILVVPNGNNTPINFGNLTVVKA